jgi:glycosyltransferase involved in cell wall biosynthesis
MGYTRYNPFRGKKGFPVRVSVVIPVFNRRGLIADTLQSAFRQEIDGLEIVVIDNCSQDGTWELLQEIRDPRLRCMRNESNVGLFGNFNRCAAQATGEYTLFLCSDDRLEPGFLSHAIALLDAEPAAALLSSRGRLIDRRGRDRGTIAGRFAAGRYAGASIPAAWFWSNYHYGENPLNYPSGVLFRTSALRACLPFREALGAPADVDMYLRVLRHGDLLVTDRIGCAVMTHADQEVVKRRAGGELTRQNLMLLEEYRADLEAAGIYDRMQRQSAVLVVAALVRTALSDPGQVLRQFRAFGRGTSELLVAAMKFIVLRSLDGLFGVRFTPYLRAAGKN